MKDEQYKEFIREQLKQSDEKHFVDIEYNKNAIWEQIDARMEKKKVLPFWIYSAAASILLLFSMGLIFNQKIDSKNIEIAKLEAQLEIQQIKMVRNVVPYFQILKMTDTVKVVHEKIVYQPVQSYDTIVLHDTVTDFVRLTDTIFVNVQMGELITDNKSIKLKKLSNNQDIAANTVSKKKNKDRKFVFLFGKPKNETPEYKTQRLISLKTK